MKPSLSFSASLRLCASLLLAASLQGQTPSVKINATNGALFAPGFTAAQILASNGVTTNGALTAVSNSLQGQITTNTTSISNNGVAITINSNSLVSASNTLQAGITSNSTAITSNTTAITAVSNSVAALKTNALTNNGTGTLTTLQVNSGGLTVYGTVYVGGAADYWGLLSAHSGLVVIGNATFASNATVTNNLTVNGNTTLGDAAGDTVTVNAGTCTAPNATNTGSTAVANVGALDGRYLPPLIGNGSPATPSIGSAINTNSIIFPQISVTNLVSVGTNGASQTNTASFASNAIFTNGMSITIAGASPTNFNGEYIITNSSATNFQYLSPTNATTTASGTITITIPLLRGYSRFLAPHHQGNRRFKTSMC
jgi:hypothetical protein